VVAQMQRPERRAEVGPVQQRTPALLSGRMIPPYEPLLEAVSRAIAQAPTGAKAKVPQATRNRVFFSLPCKSGMGVAVRTRTLRRSRPATGPALAVLAVRDYHGDRLECSGGLLRISGLLDVLDRRSCPDGPNGHR
jgi:hypothetical protein